MRGAAASVQCPRCGEASQPFSATGSFIDCRKCGLSFDPDPDRVVAPSQAMDEAPPTPTAMRVHHDTAQALRLSWSYKDKQLLFGGTFLTMALVVAARIVGGQSPSPPLVFAAFVVAAIVFPVALFQRKTLTIANGILEATRRIPSARAVTLTLSQIERVHVDRVESRRGLVSHLVTLDLRDGTQQTLTELYAADEAEYLQHRITERLGDSG